MSDTYSQLYNHYVFTVQNRDSLIHESWRVQLYKYMNGIIEQQGHKPFAINGMADHVHVLVSMNPKQAPSELIYFLKRSSTLWINQNKFVKGKFSWQQGFGVFSYGKSQLSTIVKYIENQKQHHTKKTFLGEYIHFLNAYEIEFDPRYIFKSIE